MLPQFPADGISLINKEVHLMVHSEELSVIATVSRDILSPVEPGKLGQYYKEARRRDKQPPLLV